MFFALSKIVGFFALPSNLFVVVGIAGLVLAHTRHARLGRALAALALILLGLAGFSPLGKALIEPLEDRFPPWDQTRGTPAGIVVLGGAIDPLPAPTRGAPDINEAAERLTAIPALARRFPMARIVYSGGDGRLIRRSGAEATYAGELFESFGIAKDRLLLEDHSRNTVENALFSKELVAPEPGELWLLVTSAYHMPRAVGAFRRAGFEVDAYPVDYRTSGPDDLLVPFDEASLGLRRTDVAVREWIGLFVYWVTGRSSELFPGPLPRT